MKLKECAPEQHCFHNQESRSSVKYDCVHGSVSASGMLSLCGICLLAILCVRQSIGESDSPPKPDIMVQTYYGTEPLWYIGNFQVIKSECCSGYCEVMI